MSGKLDGRVAVITGAARGQGEATARIFAEAGARVVVADVSAAEGEAVAASIGEAAIFQPLDVASEESWQTLIDRTTALWDAPDVLVNNAGVVHPVDALSLERADFDRVLSINLIGPWLGIKAVAPGMIARGKGAIVNIVSSSGMIGMNGLTAYASSKWALRGLTKNVAMELGYRGIRVNAVFPGGINTRMGNVTNDPADQLNKYYTGQTIQRIGEPEEVARTSLFLCSDDASYIAGAEITVDGGQTLGPYTPFLPGAPTNLG